MTNNVHKVHERITGYKSHNAPPGINEVDALPYVGEIDVLMTMKDQIDFFIVKEFQKPLLPVKLHGLVLQQQQGNKRWRCSASIGNGH